MVFISNNSKFKLRRKDLRKNSTPTEQILWNYLSAKKLNNLKFRRQHGFGKYIVDFYCKEKHLVIELDGDSHLSSNAKQYDLERTRFLESLNLKVMRFTNDKIKENIEEVLNIIKNLP